MPSQWAPLSHAVPMPNETHAPARQPAYLLTALGETWNPAALRLRLPLTAPEVAGGPRGHHHGTDGRRN